MPNSKKGVKVVRGEGVKKVPKTACILNQCPLRIAQSIVPKLLLAESGKLIEEL